MNENEPIVADPTPERRHVPRATRAVTDGYDITICSCPDGPHLGTRKAGTPCRCEACGFMTQDQYDHLLVYPQRLAAAEGPSDSDGPRHLAGSRGLPRPWCRDHHGFCGEPEHPTFGDTGICRTCALPIMPMSARETAIYKAGFQAGQEADR